MGEVVRVDGDGVVLEGDLEVPDDARAVVAFAHGSGSSRFSPRNRQVAHGLNRAGLGTLLLDLLTAKEGEADERTHHLRFDIPLLAERTAGAVDWLGADPRTAGLRVGLFGASTGAAAALIAAARRPQVTAVVSRGGRPDLAEAALPGVRCPVLLVVGGNDPQVLALNTSAAQVLPNARLEVVDGATHLFEEPGALAWVTSIAAAWFLRWSEPRHAGPDVGGA
ncbi:dienelactone hydrolase family protein [Actinotalea sp. M2MS4P-6]|uniref:dienelactone hydrolase family protein n=1 Tax=Actinotalea sp. M2MS4P-6 TaxID=2983762 RepID=UPI0021E46B24|nr:alpha/beta family hydrolase [Actinotalea sp. M2MS4P-6]MCV2394234.1 dienelactone hydrolase family protein [Actinotalea sp. M2MS4P-6]